MSDASNAELWQVQIALNYQEWDAIRRAMFLVAPSERWTILFAPDEDGETATLLIDVPAQTHREAEVGAEELYAKARSEGGLEPSAPLTLGVRTPIFGPSPYLRLLEESRRLIESGRYEMAVIRAQTAAELFAGDALLGLTADLRQPDEQLGSLFQRLSLVDRRGRALLQALTGFGHRPAGMVAGLSSAHNPSQCGGARRAHRLSGGGRSVAGVGPRVHRLHGVVVGRTAR